MILINLLHTILISFGIGCNVANVSNVKPRLKAVESINIQATIGSLTPTQYVDIDGLTNNVGEEWETARVSKDYIHDSNSQNNYNSLYQTNYLEIRNTVYEIRTKYKNLNRSLADAYVIMELTNYYDSAISLEIDIVYIQNSNETTNYSAIYEEQSLSKYVDLTLSSGNVQMLIDELDTTGQTAIDSELSPAGSVVSSQELNTPTITLERGETRSYLVVASSYINDKTKTVIATPIGLTITGSVLIPNYSIEVMDVPGLMFTILTLPFSFISQAFNLTIFPNTPYALNFSNLFLTVISIFVLIWLVKHIFH